MKFTIVYHTPICPCCSGLLGKQRQNDKTYYTCGDCMKVFQVIDEGQSENEIVVSDNPTEDTEGAKK